jgi:hypothetical protein
MAGKYRTNGRDEKYIQKFSHKPKINKPLKRRQCNWLDKIKIGYILKA